MSKYLCEVYIKNASRIPFSLEFDDSQKKSNTKIIKNSY